MRHIPSKTSAQYGLPTRPAGTGSQRSGSALSTTANSLPTALGAPAWLSHPAFSQMRVEVGEPPPRPLGRTLLVGVPGGGSPFALAAMSPGGFGGPVAEAMRRGDSGLPALHLLIVDDDESVRSACAEIARKMGFVVVTAAHREGARAILKHHKVDLMLLDLRLEGASGLDLIGEVKGLNPETSVIVMTAFATVANAVEAMRVSAGDYLTKPFALEELVKVLERAGERTHFDVESRRLRDKLRSPKVRGT